MRRKYNEITMKLMAFKLHRGAAKATDFNGNGQNFENSAILKARKLMGIIGKRFMLEEKLAISLCSLILPTIELHCSFLTNLVVTV